MKKEFKKKPSSRITKLWIWGAAAFLSGALLAGLTPAQAEPQKGKPTPSSPRRVVSGQERNPFLFPPGVRLVSKDAPPPATKEKATPPKTQPPGAPLAPLDHPPLPLKVKTILISDHVRLALIDRYIVTIGDMIYEEKVLDIQTDRVILGKGDKKRTLLLFPNTIPLTVENP